MIQFEIQWEMKQLYSISKYFIQATFPSYYGTMEKSAKQVAQTWRNFLQGEDNLDVKLPEDAKITSKMIQSIKNEPTANGWKVHSENPQMEALVKGTSPVHFDMKQTHPYGPKSRVSKKGIPYLIIPFRWGTPNEKGTERRWNNTIPTKEYNLILKDFELSEYAKDVKGNWTHQEDNYRGESVERKNYKWRSRLSPEDAWDDRSVGMVRMKDVRNSTYYTFRIISAKSPQKSWWYSRHGTEGIDLRGALHRKFDNKIKTALDQALENDVKMLVGK